MAQSEKEETRQERWSKVRPTKQTLVWFCLGSVVVVLIIGFGFGGWVTGGTAEDMAVESGEDAVVDRLAPICVYQFNQDPEKDQKLEELEELSSRQRNKYVAEQGWATMPGEEEPDSTVAGECARQLIKIS
jgi:hypothetical protein